MKQSALNRFRHEFRRWVAAHNVEKGFSSDPDEMLEVLSKRIPIDRQQQIGAALLNGWIETEKEPGRGYFVRESDRTGPRGGQFVLIHQGHGRVAPCWELFVQLADYGWLRSIAEYHGLNVQLEDRLMDLTVCDGDSLVLYVENKTSRADVDKLLPAFVEYGRSGFGLADADKGNDPLRKAKYLVRPGSHPPYMGISAIGFRELYSVVYGEGNTFKLREDSRSFSAVLAEASRHGESAAPVARLASDLESKCRDHIWVSTGSGQTAFNFYLADPAGDVVLIGVYDDGRIWTDIKALGSDRASVFAGALAKLGITLPASKVWSFWRDTEGDAFTLDESNTSNIAAAVESVLRNAD